MKKTSGDQLDGVPIVIHEEIAFDLIELILTVSLLWYHIQCPRRLILMFKIMKNQKLKN